MAKDSLPKFWELNPKFIDYNKYDNTQLERYYFKHKHRMFMKAHNIGRKTFIPMHSNQLKKDLKKEKSQLQKLPKNWKDLMH